MPVHPGEEPTFVDNVALSPGDRRHVETVFNNDDVRLAGRTERAEQFARQNDVEDQVGAYTEPTSVTGGTEGIFVTETAGAAGKGAVAESADKARAKVEEAQANLAETQKKADAKVTR